jgi:hypothetical protein
VSRKESPENSGLLTTHKDGSMVSHMKTTVDIADDLLIEAKKRAVELRRPLRALVEEGLRLRLATPGARERPKIKWVVAEGGAPAAMRERDTMYEWMRDNP